MTVRNVAASTRAHRVAPPKKTALTLISSAVTPASRAPTLTTPDPLRRLLGNARSTILVQAAEPVSTTALVAATGLPLGTVGGHLRVLTEAGLLQKRRSGREVLYWWTDAARALVAGASPF